MIKDVHDFMDCIGGKKNQTQPKRLLLGDCELKDGGLATLWNITLL